jgi:chromosome segregation ATPase
MKAVIIVLALLCAALGFGLFQSNSKAGRETAATQTQLEKFTNQVSELATKVAFERAEASHAQSNLQHVAIMRTGELLNTSNRLVQLNLLYRAAQSDARTAQTDAQSLAAKVAVLEAEREASQRTLTKISTLEKQLAETRDKLAGVASERNAIAKEAGRLEVELADLQRKLDDVGFLRMQLTRAEENAVALRRLAKAGHNAPVSSKARLELLEDGTVRPVVPTPVGDPK